MAAPTIKKIKLSDLRQHMENANLHSERGQYMVERSIERFGSADAGTIDKNDVIVSGNLRSEILSDKGTEEVYIIETQGQPVFIKRTDIDVNTPEGKELAIALNRTHQVSLAWDAEQLLADVNSGIDLGEWFHEDELAALLEGLIEEEPTPDPGPQIDRAAELNEVWQVERGQIWEVPSLSVAGKAHRVMCGDSTREDDVKALLDGNKADMVFTDPPYNVTDNEWDKFETDDFINFLSKIADILIFASNPKSSFYVCLNWRYVSELKLILDKVLTIRNWIIWHHISRGANFNFYTPSHQDILFYTKSDEYYFDVTSDLEPYAESSIERDKYNKKQYVLERSGKNPSDVWYYPQIRGNSEENEAHPTQKPLELVERAIRISSPVSSLILDVFLGSGTTLVACEQLGRVGYGMEISENYVAVTLQRLADMGLTPRLLSKSEQDSD